jgi:serine/threonine protein phosphatase 1
MKQALDRAGVTKHDQLISLGDVCDRYPDTAKCVDYLLQYERLIPVRGNHDHWTMEWMLHDKQPEVWLNQGGRATMESYTPQKRVEHLPFFKHQLSYYEELEKREVFVHAGWKNKRGIGYDDESIYLWDRSFWLNRVMPARGTTPPELIRLYHQVFIGHTPTLNFGTDRPIKVHHVWNLDTGGGYPSGKITVMDVDTQEYWQSDRSDSLYGF